jgi:protease IV
MSRTKTAILIICVIIILVFVGSLAIGLMGRSFGDRIGVIEIEGTIIQSGDAMEDIVKFKEDPTIKGVVIRINTPGGGVGPTQEIYREVRKLRDKKYVYVSMGSVCASGGYYIASAGHKIFANPSTITGSIGVIMEQTVIEELLKKIGVQSNTIKAGDYKDVGSPLRKMTPEEREYLNRIVSGIHQQFISDVAAGRGMSLGDTRKIADGKIFTGLRAKEIGMVDDIGNFYDSIDDLKKTLKIKGKPVLVYGKRPFSLMKWLVSSMAHDLISQSQDSPFKFLFKGGQGL